MENEDNKEQQLKGTRRWKDNEQTKENGERKQKEEVVKGGKGRAR